MVHWVAAFCFRVRMIAEHDNFARSHCLVALSLRSIWRVEVWWAIHDTVIRTIPRHHLGTQLDHESRLQTSLGKYFCASNIVVYVGDNHIHMVESL